MLPTRLSVTQRSKNRTRKQSVYADISPRSEKASHLNIPEGALSLPGPEEGAVFRDVGYLCIVLSASSPGPGFRRNRSRNPSINAPLAALYVGGTVASLWVVLFLFFSFFFFLFFLLLVIVVL